MAHSQPEGFLASPPTGKGPGILVLHAWWGLNDTIKAFCKRLAESGFVAFAPDLYHGKVADTIAGAEALGSALDANHLQAKAEIAEAAQFLSERSGQNSLAVIGFSLGAYYALDLSAADPEHIRSVVIFYGTGPADFSKSRAAYLGHFAENDPYEPLANVNELEETLRSAGRPVTFYVYNGTGHWFFEPDRMDAYNPAAASLAWERTLAFLKPSSSSETNFQTELPDPALKRLEKLVGKWELKGRTLDSQVDNITGWNTFEWMPGGFFLKSEGEINFKGFVMQSLEIIAYDPQRKIFPSNVYSSMSGNVFSYEWDIQGNNVKHSGLGATYTGTINEDGDTLIGGWRPDEGTPTTGETAYDAVMTRVN